MIKHFLCLVLGHKRIVKTYVGKHYLVQVGDVEEFTYGKSKFCLRCGKDL